MQIYHTTHCHFCKGPPDPDTLTLMVAAGKFAQSYRFREIFIHVRGLIGKASQTH
jgi:hypothetical protein